MISACPKAIAVLLLLLSPSMVRAHDGRSKLVIYDVKTREVYETIYSKEGCSFIDVVGDRHLSARSDLSKQSKGSFYAWNINPYSRELFYVPKDFSGKRRWTVDGRSFVVNRVFTVVQHGNKYTLYDVSDVTDHYNRASLFFNKDGNYVGANSPLSGTTFMSDLSNAERFYSSCHTPTKSNSEGPSSQLVIPAKPESSSWTLDQKSGFRLSPE